MIIRELEKDEYHLLKEFTYQAIFQRDEANPIPRSVLDDPQVKAFYKDFGREGDECLVAIVDGKLAGAAWTRIIAGETKGFGNIDENTPEFAVSLFYEYRGLGIGTKLMQRMLELLEGKGHKCATLAVQKDNYAVKMYKKLGFSILKEMEEEYLMVYEMGIRYFEYGDREMDYLRKKDKKLGAAIDQIGIIKREVNPDIFSSLVESIIGQQISSKAARTVSGKLMELCGMDSEKLYSLKLEEIQSCGMSMRKAIYIKNIADAAMNKAVDFDSLSSKSDEEIIEQLTQIKGIGVWTAEMLLIFSLMRPDVVSYGDLAIRRGIMRLYGHKELPRERFKRYAKRYSPYGSVASLYLWEMSAEGFEVEGK